MDDDEDRNNIFIEIENAISTMIIYRSLYLLKEKIKIHKEKLKNIYIKYNTNNNASNEILDYKINKKDFSIITEEIFKNINLLILKITNQKDIFLSKIFYENKIEEMINILNEIQNLINNNSFSIIKYNLFYYNKKIKPFLNDKFFNNKDKLNSITINENNRYNKDLSENKTNNENNKIEIDSNNKEGSEENEENKNNNDDNNNNNDNDEIEMENNEENNNEIINEEEKENDDNNNNNENNISQENISEDNKNNQNISNTDDNEEINENNNNEEVNENEEGKNTDNNNEELNENEEEENNEELNENEKEEEEEENNENNIEEEEKEEREEEEDKEEKEDKENIKNNNNDNSKDEFKIAFNKDYQNKNILNITNNEPKLDKIQFMYIPNVKINEKIEDHNIEKTKPEEKNKKEEEMKIKYIPIEKINVKKLNEKKLGEKKSDEKKSDEKKLEEKNNKEEEIQIKIVEYNRKGKIIKNTIQLIEGNKILINEKKDYQNLEKDETFLYIETLPLILADFLQENKNYAIIEIENEISQDLYTRFDNNLINVINEYDELKKSGNISNIVIKSKELEIAIKEYNKIKQNIKMFKDILKKKKKMNEKAEYIENTIEKLVGKEIYLEHKIKILNEKQSLSLLDKIKNMNKEYSTYNNKIVSGRNINSQENLKIFNSMNISKFSSKLSLINSHESINSDNISINYKKNNNFNFINLTNKINSIISEQNYNFDKDRDEKINKALKEIFYFYSKKHNIVGHSLFSKIEEKKKHIDLHEFSLFCSDFKIPIARQKIVEIFKKNVSNCKLMEFKEFKASLGAIANAMFESKKKSMKDKIFIKNNKIKQLELKENQETEEENLKIIFEKELKENNKIMKFSSSNKNNKEKRTKYFLIQKNKLKSEISDIKNIYNNSLTKSNKELLEELYNYLNVLTDDKKYRLKMKGFNSSPLILNSLKNNTQIKNEIITNNENEKINLNKIKKAKIIKRKPIIGFDNIKLFKMNKRLKSNEKTNAKNNNVKSTDIIKDKKNRIWWSKLKNYNINDLNLNEKEKSLFLELDNINDNFNSQNISKITNDNNNNKNDLNNKEEEENNIQKDFGIKKLKLIKNNSSININYKNRYFKLKNEIVLPPIINNNNYNNYLVKKKYAINKN